MKTHAQTATLPQLPRAVLLLAALTGFGFPLAQAADAAPAADAEKPKWQTSAGLGASVTSGNSESLLFTADFITGRKAPKNEMVFGIVAGYGKAKPQESSDNPDPSYDKNTDFLRAFEQYNQLFGEKLYAYFKTDFLHDDISEIMYRVTITPGVGYYFIKNDRMDLSGELGPGYVFERVVPTQTSPGLNPGDPPIRTWYYDNNDYASLRVAERFNFKISKTARLWQTVEYLPEISRWADNWILNAEVGIEADINTHIALRVVGQDSYDNEPAPGRESNDLKLIAGIRYKF